MTLADRGSVRTLICKRLPMFHTRRESVKCRLDVHGMISMYQGFLAKGKCAIIGSRRISGRYSYITSPDNVIKRYIAVNLLKLPVHNVERLPLSPYLSTVGKIYFRLRVESFGGRLCLSVWFRVPRNNCTLERRAQSCLQHATLAFVFHRRTSASGVRTRTWYVCPSVAGQ